MTQSTDLYGGGPSLGLDLPNRVAARYGLSPSVARVAARALVGLNNAEIARTLDVSKGTVATYVGIARGRGAPIPHGRRTPPTSGALRLNVSEVTALALHRAALRRGVSTHVLAETLLATAARDDLIAAILDDASPPD